MLTRRAERGDVGGIVDEVQRSRGDSGPDILVRRGTRGKRGRRKHVNDLRSTGIPNLALSFFLFFTRSDLYVDARYSLRQTEWWTQEFLQRTRRT